MKILKQTPILILILMGFFIIPLMSRTYAYEVRSLNQVTVTGEEIIEGTLFANGENITIEGNVLGDLFCAGTNILISGTVEGDVLCVGQNLILKGIVKGDIRSAGQSIELSGQVDRSVTLAGQEINLTGVEIGNDIQIFGQNIKVSGQVAKSLISAGQNIILSGTVGEDAFVAGQIVTLTDTASIGGDFSYASDKPAIINPGAIITGITQKKDLDFDKNTPKPLKPKFNFMTAPKPSFMSILIWIGLGLLGIALFPEFFRKTAQKIKDRPLTSFGYGIVVMLLFPSVFLFLLVTIIGIPVAILGLISIILVFFTSRLFVSLYLGERLMQLGRPNLKVNLVLAQILGIIVLYLAFKIPFLGPVLSFFASIIGTGALLVNSKSGKGK